MVRRKIEENKHTGIGDILAYYIIHSIWALGFLGLVLILWSV